MRVITVPISYDNKKLNAFLLSAFPNLSQNTLHKALRKKDIRINDTRISENVTLCSGDILKIFIEDDLLYNGKTLELDILYEDENIIILNKPIGIEVVDSKEQVKSLADYVKVYCPQAKPCHRLDRNTSGLVLFAKNTNTLELLLNKFKEKQIEKHYLAKVTGILPKKRDRLEDYLFKDNKKSLVYISSTPKTGYQNIITSYRVLEENKETNTSLLDIVIETRTHTSNSCTFSTSSDIPLSETENMERTKSIEHFIKKRKCFVPIV